MEQRSEEWFQARLGKVTASKVAEILAKNKSGSYSERRNKYMMSLVAERIAGIGQPSINSARMIRGNELECVARTEYEIRSGNDVDIVGLVEHPTIKDFGASPDGLVGEEGLIEIKCPDTVTHITTIQTGKINPDYIIQMQVQMACTGRKWCDFISYDDRLPSGPDMFLKRVARDQDKIDSIEEEVKLFLEECLEIEKNINQYHCKLGKK